METIGKPKESNRKTIRITRGRPQETKGIQMETDRKTDRKPIGKPKENYRKAIWQTTGNSRKQQEHPCEAIGELMDNHTETHGDHRTP